MTYTTILLITIASLYSGNKNVSSDLLKKTIANTGTACEYLTADYLSTLFPGATNFKQKSSEKPYPTCSYEFEVDGISHMARLTLAIGLGSEKNFDNAMKYQSEKELVSGVGEKAYYIVKQNQVSAWSGKNIIHINIDNNKEASMKSANEILDKLNN